MPLTLDDTIVAIASASGGAMRGILRLSGPNTADCLRRSFQTSQEDDWTTTSIANVIHGQLALAPPFSRVPCDLYYWPNQRSYTRQPTAELHLIGSPPLLAAALQAIGEAGARLAEPGEFTLRAFLAGRLDLTQAEAVLGVIDAGSRAELEVALQQLAGGLAAPLHELREQLLNLLAHLEAGLDFVEEDIEFITSQELDDQLAKAVEIVNRITQQMTARGETRGEARVVLVGSPNVGKSSLLNALAQNQAAIVANEPGTTRDYLACHVNFAGVACQLIDTAGVETVAFPDSIARHAQDMATQQHTRAHLQLFCLDSTRPLNVWEREQIAEFQTASQDPKLPRIIVLTKTDESVFNFGETPADAIRTSSRSGAGLDQLRLAIAKQLTESAAQESTVVAGTAVRCQESLRLAAETLARARKVVQSKGGEELVAAEIRVALEELGKVVGVVYTEDILDRIFSRFCIGK